MAVLVIAEHDNTVLKAGTLNTVTAALDCGHDVHVLIAGQACMAAAQAATAIAGVSQVLLAEAPHLANGLAETVAAQVLAVAANYTHILAPATAYGKNVLPRVAALLDVEQISEVIQIDAPDTFRRTIYAGNAIATVQSPEAVKVLTVRTTCFAQAAVSGGAAEIKPVQAVADGGRSRFVSSDIAQSDRPELPAAKIVIAGGRGVGSAENFQLLVKLADKLGAALGASRAAVDAGYVPNDCQIGQTGKIVAPQLYIAVGISGAIQHVAGIKDAKTIVAINKDPEAPIFTLADYGLVGDLFEILPQLIAAIE